MISAIAWVPKGVAKPVTEAQPSHEELAAMQAEAAALEEGEEPAFDGDDSASDSSGDDGMDDDADADPVARARAVAAALKAGSSAADHAHAASTFGTGSIEEALAELDMEHYDDDDGEGGGGRPFGGGRPGMSYYRSNLEDPYIELPEDEPASEAEDEELRDSDLLILAARNEDDVSHLEVWVYEEPEGDADEGNLYVHHAVMLPAFPLAVAWMDCDPQSRRESANLAAVGTFSPGIEIWDLDVIDSVEPIVTLGGELQKEDAPPSKEDMAADRKKKKKMKAKMRGHSNQNRQKKAAAPVREGSHTDAVLGLAWNREARHVLASASADHTVKVWDVTTGRCDQTLAHHSGKVQAVAWNAAQASVLLSGGFDQAACMADMRTIGGESLRWQLGADAEAVAWMPGTPTAFLASSEDGIVAAFDARKGGGSAPLWRLAAHEAPACSLSFCPAAPGLLATASTDKKVKLWDVEAGEPSAVASSDMGAGALFSAAFCAESPFLIAAGGAKGSVAVWDTLSNSAVATKYGRQARAAGRQKAVAEAAAAAEEES